MAARAIWKGSILFGDVKVPVKLYSAVEEQAVHFRLLAPGKHVPVQQKMVNPATDEPVSYAEVQRGFELDDGRFVVLDKQDLEHIAPKPSRDIEVVQFLKPQLVGNEWFVRPYYLGPDGSDETYFALVRALTEEKKEGLVRWVMRGTEYTGVLRAEGEYLLLNTLRHAEEVVPASELPKPEGREHNDKEAKMAEQLIASFEDEFDPTAFADTYRERVLEFVAQKAAGKRPRLKKVRDKKMEEPSLADALARSLKATRKEPKHGARKAS
jgi:DNA end-binding protein Ku